jgi:hypothetical protein
MSRHEKDDRWTQHGHPGPKDGAQRKYEEEPRRFGKGKKRNRA